MCYSVWSVSFSFSLSFCILRELERGRGADRCFNLNILIERLLLSVYDIYGYVSLCDFCGWRRWLQEQGELRLLFFPYTGKWLLNLVYCSHRFAKFCYLYSHHETMQLSLFNVEAVSVSLCRWNCLYSRIVLTVMFIIIYASHVVQLHFIKLCNYLSPEPALVAKRKGKK